MKIYIYIYLCVSHLHVYKTKYHVHSMAVAGLDGWWVSHFGRFTPLKFKRQRFPNQDAGHRQGLHLKNINAKKLFLQFVSNDKTWATNYNKQLGI